MNTISKPLKNRASQTLSPVPITEQVVPAPVLSAHVRNFIQPYDASWFEDIRVNLSAAEKRIATLKGRRSVKKMHKRPGCSKP